MQLLSLCLLLLGTVWPVPAMLDGSLPQSAAPAEKNVPQVESLAWLAGHWEGTGFTNGVEGAATRFWTAPVEGVVSTTFQWHVAEQDHVHFAFSVIEHEDAGASLRFIHYGRDFQAFEDAPLEYDLVEASDQGAFFRCRAHCQAHHRIERTGPDAYRASWIKVAGDDPPFVIEYRRIATAAR